MENHINGYFSGLKAALQKKKSYQISRKTNPLIHTRTCAYQGVRNARFFRKFGMLFFLVTSVLRFAFFPLLPTKCGRQKCIMKYKTTHIFICNTFISNATLKLAKNQANAKHKPEAELLLFENYSHSSSTLSSKNNRTYSKKKQKNKCLCIHEIIWFVVMKMRMKTKNRSHRYDINRPRPRINRN